MTYINIGLQLFYDGTWNTIISKALARDQIRIRRGASNESQHAAPTSMTVSVHNRDSELAPRNPTSSLYGKIGRNTPLRVTTGTAHVGAADGTEVDTTSQVAPSVTSPTDDAVLLSFWGAPEPAGTYTLPGGQTDGGSTSGTGGSVHLGYETFSASGATGTRTATFSASEDYVSASVLLHGTSTAVEDSAATGSTASTSSSTVVGWWTVLFAYFAWDSDDAHIPDYPSSDESGWILLADSGTLEVADTDADKIRVKAWAKRWRTAGERDIRVEPIGTVNVFTARAEVSGAAVWSIRGAGEVTSWPARRDLSGNDVWVPLEAAGILRRIGHAVMPEMSPARREVLLAPNDSRLEAYWPCEEGSSSSRLASPIGATAMFVRGDVDLSNFSGFAGSQPVPTLGADGSLAGPVPPYPAGETAARGMFNIPSGGLTDQSSLLVLSNLRDVDRFEIQYLTSSSGQLRLRALDSAGTVLDQSGTIDSNLDGESFALAVDLVQDGSDIDWSVTITPISFGNLGAATTSSGTFTSLDLGHSYKLAVGEDVAAGGLDGLSVGHLLVARSIDVAPNYTDAMIGWTGEAGGRRAARLCAEEDVPFVGIGDLDETETMGPQGAATAEALLRGVADADGGILYEPREFIGLAYHTRQGLVNRSTALTLDYSDGSLALPFNPEPDDFLVVNEATVSRPTGGSETVEQTTGPLNTQSPGDDPLGVGRYPTSRSVAVQSDIKLREIAAWLVHLGTVDEPRYPRVTVNLVREQQLAGDTAQAVAMAGVDVGDRLIIENLPLDVWAEDASQLVVGHNETLDSFHHEMTYNLVPESPWRWAETDDAVLGRVDSDASTLAAQFVAGTDTSMSVAVSDGFLWTTDGAEYSNGFDVRVSGVVLHVTAISGASSPQTFTVDQTPVNSVTAKTIPAGETVSLADPAIVGR